MHSSNDAESKINTKRLVTLFTPSWLSGLIAVTVGLVMSVGVITVFNLNGTVFQQELLGFQVTTSSQSVLTLPGQSPPGSTANSLQNTWPLLAFWGIIGLAVYFIAEIIIKWVSGAAALTKELNYVNANRDTILKDTIIILVFRLVTIILWLIFLNSFIKQMIPYSIMAAHAGASDIKSMAGISDALVAFSLIAFGLHVNTIFFRLALRRPRVFSSSDYLDV